MGRYTKRITLASNNHVMRKNFPKALDLHGLTTDQAFSKVVMFLKMHQMIGSFYCKIITGESGIMRKDFYYWTETPVMRPYIDNVKKAHEDGAYLIKIKSSKNKGNK